MTFVTRTIDELHIDDEVAFRAVPHYAALKDVLRRARYRFRCLGGSSVGRWDRALVLNLTFWGGGDGDVLVDERLAADVVTHAAWHHLVAKDLAAHAGSADAMLFGESVASAYDVYLVGKLLGANVRSGFLDTQVAAMSEAASATGLGKKSFAALLQSLAVDPEQAFADLRSLLFTASTSLLAAPTMAAALKTLERLDTHRFSSLLHHYELSTWVLYARAYAPRALAPVPAIRKLDRGLKADYLDQLLARYGLGLGSRNAERASRVATKDR